MEIHSLINPAKSANDRKLLVELVLQLPEQRPGILLLLVGVVNADISIGRVRNAQRRPGKPEKSRCQKGADGVKPESLKVPDSHGVAAGAHTVCTQPRYLCAVGVGDIDIQVIIPGYPAQPVSLSVQADLGGPLLGVGIEEKVEIGMGAGI